MLYIDKVFSKNTWIKAKIAAAAEFALPYFNNVTKYN
jgi:hypothetical protein